MVLEQTLQLKLSQKLILTPALQLAIKLLPMATLELVDVLNQEVVDNPLLEEVSAEELQQTDEAAHVDTADPDPQPTRDTQDPWDDADFAYFFGEYLDNGDRPRVPRDVKELPPIENTLSTVSSLADHLTWQLSAQTGDEVVQTIGTAIVGNLDEDGYLAASIQEIAVMGNWPEADVNRVLALVHTFDPMGVAARDLQECLLLQLRHLVVCRNSADANPLAENELSLMSWPPSRLAKASFRTVRGMDDYSGRPGSSGSALASISLIFSSSVLCLALDRHLVFDHGPGRQGGRSTESASTLLGRTRGRDEHRTTQPC